jgi:thiol-disulfide isomerase/thioredoxin
MNGILHLGSVTVAIAGFLQTPDPQQIKGTLSDRIVAEGMMARIELRPAAPGEVPGAREGDNAFIARTPQFRPPGSEMGLLVAYLENDAGKFIFIDRDLDGRITESEGISYRAGQEVTADLPLAGMPQTLPFRLQIASDTKGENFRLAATFTAAFRVEGYLEIGGMKTLVSLPFNVQRRAVDVRQGKIGVDTNGDGKIEAYPRSGGETQFVRAEERLIFRIRDKYISLESADVAMRTLTVREHTADEYTVVEIAVGSPLTDFAFTDFDGKARKLSDFRGKYLLIDVWGSWCKPCVEDLPKLKAAYDRFKGEDFEILGVDYEHGATLDQVRKLLKEKNVTWTNADPSSVKDLVQKRWRIMAYPTLMLLDPQGVVIETGGALRGARLVETLERVLEKR